MDSIRRVALGTLAVLFLAGGAAGYALGGTSETYLMLGSSGLRIGLVLGAFWLAYPQLSGIPWWFVQAVLVGALAVAVRPKWAILVLPILAALWIVHPKKKAK